MEALIKKFPEEEVKLALITAGSMSKPELKETLEKYAIKSPDNNDLGEINDFNLMFATTIGPNTKEIA